MEDPGGCGLLLSRWVWSTSILGQLWSYLAGAHRMGDVETGVT